MYFSTRRTAFHILKAIRFFFLFRNDSFTRGQPLISVQQKHSSKLQFTNQQISVLFSSCLVQKIKIILHSKQLYHFYSLPYKSFPNPFLTGIKRYNYHSWHDSQCVYKYKTAKLCSNNLKSLVIKPQISPVEHAPSLLYGCVKDIK